MTSETEAGAEVAASREREKAAIRRSLSRIDPVALGAGIACVAGLGLFLATVILVWQDAGRRGENLQVLVNFFPGYRVTAAGAVIGAIYATAGGFAFGYLVATFRNFALRVVLFWARWEALRWRRQHMLDEV